MISLDTYIGTIECEISKFNAQVKLLSAGLSARGQTSNYLLINLFKGYKAVSYSIFVRYIEINQETYQDGQDLTPTAYLLLVDNKFKILKLKGGWNAPSYSGEKILDLQAEIQNLNKRTSKRDHNKNEYNPNKTQGKYSKQNTTCLKKNINYEESEPKISTCNDTAWNWCSKETKVNCLVNWRVHKTSEFRGISIKNPVRVDKGISRHKKLKLAKFMDTLIQ